MFTHTRTSDFIDIETRNANIDRGSYGFAKRLKRIDKNEKITLDYDLAFKRFNQHEKTREYHIDISGEPEIGSRRHMLVTRDRHIADKSRAIFGFLCPQTDITILSQLVN
jgi:hypothetical protein